MGGTIGVAGETVGGTGVPEDDAGVALPDALPGSEPGAFLSVPGSLAGADAAPLVTTLVAPFSLGLSERGKETS